MEAVSGTIALETGDDDRGATEAFARRSGPRGAHAHLFIAAARHLGIPSRFVNGYLVRGRSGEATCHAWVEAHVAGLGWVGFDPVNNLCPKGEHVQRRRRARHARRRFHARPQRQRHDHLLKISVAA